MRFKEGIILGLIFVLIIILCKSVTLIDVDDGNIITPSYLYSDGDLSIVLHDLHPINQVVMFSIFLLFENKFLLLTLNIIFVFVLFYYAFLISNDWSIKIRHFILILSVFILSSIIIERVMHLTPYIPSVSLSLMSIHYLNKYFMHKKLSTLILASTLLIGGILFFNIALTIAPLIGILCIIQLIKQRISLKEFIKIGIVYAIPILIWAIPRIIIAKSDFLASPGNWFVLKYILTVNQDFWEYPLTENLGIYLTKFFSIFYSTFNLQYLLPLLIYGVAISIRRSKFLYPFVSFLIILIPFFLLKVSLFSRYYSFFIFPLIIYLSFLFMEIKDKKILILVISLILILGLLNFSSIVQKNTFSQTATLTDNKFFNEVINDSKNIISRTSTLQASYKNRIFTIGSLKEEEAIIFLVWDNQTSVCKLLKTKNIGWVMLHNNLRLESQYYDSWLSKYFKKNATHYEKIKQISEEVYPSKIYTLYKIDPKFESNC